MTSELASRERTLVLICALGFSLLTGAALAGTVAFLVEIPPAVDIAAGLLVGIVLFLMAFPLALYGARGAHFVTGKSAFAILRGTFPRRMWVLLPLLVGLILASLLLFLLLRPPAVEGLTGLNYLGILTLAASGGTEEVVFRLGVMFAVARLMAKFKFSNRWIPIGTAAVVFAAAHLAPVSPFPRFFVWTMIQKSVLGGAFGYVCWEYGIEAAILLHFAFDLSLLLPTL